MVNYSGIFITLALGHENRPFRLFFHLGPLVSMGGAKFRSKTEKIENQKGQLNHKNTTSFITEVYSKLFII
jgi:hypothetical protein